MEEDTRGWRRIKENDEGCKGTKEDKRECKNREEGSGTKKWNRVWKRIAEERRMNEKERDGGT